MFLIFQGHYARQIPTFRCCRTMLVHFHGTSTRAAHLLLKRPHTSVQKMASCAFLLRTKNTAKVHQKRHERLEKGHKRERERQRDTFVSLDLFFLFAGALQKGPRMAQEGNPKTIPSGWRVQGPEVHSLFQDVSVESTNHVQCWPFAGQCWPWSDQVPWQTGILRNRMVAASLETWAQAEVEPILTALRAFGAFSCLKLLAARCFFHTQSSQSI